MVREFFFHTIAKNHLFKIVIMGTTDDNRKFKRKVKQTNPTNPSGNTNIETNDFDIDKKTIKKQQKKS